jgi:hypothetical protein
MILGKAVGKLHSTLMHNASWRELLKQNKWFAQLWPLVRAYQQEMRIQREVEFYQKQAQRLNLPTEMSQDNLRKQLHERLASRNLIPQPKERLHIIYATPLGNWEKHNIPPALENFGELTPFYLSEQGFEWRSQDWLERRHELDAALVEFVQTTHKQRPVDILVSYLSGWLISPEAIQAINRMGIVTCAFWWDDRLSFRGELRGGRYSGSASLAAAYDLNLTNSTDSIAKYLVEGGLAMFWPEGANPEHFRPLERTFDIDVSFIGACYGQRPAYVDYLRRNGVKVEAFGHGWPNGSVSADEMVDIYARSRINLGFSGIGYSMKEMCLKGRDFEVPMCGALYVTSKQPDLHRVYNVGREVVTYCNKKELLFQIKRLLQDPCESEKIRKAARMRCVRDHTWERRFYDIIRLIGFLE